MRTMCHYPALSHLYFLHFGLEMQVGMPGLDLVVMKVVDSVVGYCQVVWGR